MPLSVLITRICIRSFHLTRSIMSARARVQIFPSSKTLFDEPLQMKVEGLIPKQSVELRAKLTDDKGVVFKSSAVYCADTSGTVDLGTSSSLSGSYTGVEPMGLFWSMAPETPHSRLIKRDTSSPFLVNIEVADTTDLGHTLGNATVERRFMVEGARRVPVKFGRVRGTLFFPPGPGPFPGVLDLYTLGGGLTEVRGSLLANKGFVVLCLAFYRYDDLPKTVTHFDLEYFEEALTFLRSLPEVKGPGVGLISISKSGDLALAIASLLPDVSATVWINGCNAATVFPLHCKDRIFPAVAVDISKIRINGFGLIEIKDVVTDPMAEVNKASLIPIEKANGKFLFVASEDDRNWNSYLFAEQATKRLKDHGKDNFEVVKYPKAGHFLEVPYMPFYPSGIHAAVGQVVSFGGNAKVHADAHVDLWRRIQRFFHKHLNSNSHKAKL
uniref:Acyl-coenzyme A thioesterase 1-like n=1 Tax=Paramormyrops kingsleyae TaxID=1676925 RepID=A0A3B3RZI4_9TELE|nr:acyl-coenzyme A thioesterase 1-like [Paramormyrops kingsleyae]